jgi:hypothetical protein
VRPLSVDDADNRTKGHSKSGLKVVKFNSPKSAISRKYAPFEEIIGFRRMEYNHFGNRRAREAFEELDLVSELMRFSTSIRCSTRETSTDAALEVMAEDPGAFLVLGAPACVGPKFGMGSLKKRIVMARRQQVGPLRVLHRNSSFQHHVLRRLICEQERKFEGIAKDIGATIRRAQVMGRENELNLNLRINGGGKDGKNGDDAGNLRKEDRLAVLKRYLNMAIGISSAEYAYICEILGMRLDASEIAGILEYRRCM